MRRRELARSPGRALCPVGYGGLQVRVARSVLLQLLVAATVPLLSLVLAGCGHEEPPPAKHEAGQPLPRGVLWRANFEAGGLTPWESVQRQTRDRVRAVPSPRDEGRRSARFEVQPGDYPARGNRAEIVARGCSDRKRSCYPDADGDERWYAWSTLFPRKRYPAHRDWQVVFQLARDPWPPLIAMGVNGNRISLDHNRSTRDLFNGLWRARLQRGRWQRFVLRVKFSPSPRVGLVELWRNGKRVLRKTHLATMRRSRDGKGLPLPAYLKFGLYRAKTTPVTQIVYHDNVRIGKSHKAVASR